VDEVIRYVHIGGQITEGLSEFAFYDTVNDEFVTMSGYQCWVSPQEFIRHFNSNTKRIPESWTLERFISLIPIDPRASQGGLNEG